MQGIWLIGSEGYLGRALKTSLCAPHWRLWCSQYHSPQAADYLNLAEPDLSPWQEILPQLDWALICAARPRLYDCQNHPNQTELVNVSGPLALAQALYRAGVVPVFFSSDYVFAGDRAPYKETDPLCPLNAYGKQKAALEKGLQATLPSDAYLLLRLTKLYDLKPENQGLLADMARAWSQGKTISVATDQWFNPLWLTDAVEAILGLIRQKARGLYHLGGPNGMNRFQLAQNLAQALGMSPAAQKALIHPVALQDLGEPFQRPRDTRLSTSRLEAALPDWQPLSLQQACQAFSAHGPVLPSQKGIKM